MRTKRLFFALWSDAALQIALAGATRDVVLASKGRAVPTENFHITLAFLGSVPETDIGKVEDVATQVAREHTGGRVQIAFDVIEYWKKAQLICATSRVAASVTLADKLKTDLVAAGFAPDLKPFRPHISLARDVVRVARVIEMEPVVWAFTEFVLVESKTRSAGAVYTAFARFPFVPGVARAK